MGRRLPITSLRHVSSMAITDRSAHRPERPDQRTANSVESAGIAVHRGNLLVIPTGSALLYAESIYLQADRSPMPELRLVVLALQDRLAYGTTFEAALSSLFNGTESSITQVSPTQGSAAASATTGQTPASVTFTGNASDSRDKEIQEAAQEFAEYQR